MAENRRSFLKTAGAGAAALALGELMAGRAFAAEDGRHEGFIRQVTKARIFDLSPTWDENSPIASVNPFYEMHLEATHQNTRGTFGDGGKLSFTSEVQHFSGQHGAPSIDAIGHIGRNGKLYGGVDAATATSDPRGIGRDAAATGAHLDIARCCSTSRARSRAMLMRCPPASTSPTSTSPRRRARRACACGAATPC